MVAITRRLRGVSVVLGIEAPDAEPEDPLPDPARVIVHMVAIGAAPGAHHGVGSHAVRLIIRHAATLVKSLNVPGAGPCPP